MALLWLKHGPYMVPQIGSSSILIIGPRDILCQISYFWVYPVSPFLKKWQKYGPLWPKHGPPLGFKIGSS